MKTAMKIAGIVGIAAVFIIVASLIGAIPLYFLWNWLMPELFRLPAITFWQALGLNLLAWILFKPAASSSSK
jgi:hypothetical protein